MITYSNAGLMTLLLFVPLLFGVILKKKKLLTENLTCCLILFTGVVLRLIYISYTNFYYRQYDVHPFFSGDGGHSGYIEYLFENHSFPDFDPREVWQFYHPPLHHIICAAWLTLMELIGIPARYAGVHSLIFLPMLYSSLFCIFSYLSFKRLGFKSTALYVSTALVTFHPTLIMLSGSLNNDMLSSLFAMMAIYYTIKWSQDRKWLDIIMIALSMGLGMFTKLSVGLIAPAIAVVFLIVLIKQRKEIKKLIPQFLVFAVICLPIGLFWSVRNYVKFGVPLNYVPRLPETEEQFIDMAPLERLTNWSLYQFSSPFTQWAENGSYNEFNPFIAILKSSLFFDQNEYFVGNVTLQSFCAFLFLLNIVLAVFFLVALVFNLVKNKDIKIEIKALLGLIFAIVFGNYITFCINYPHVCTENMRYCVPLIFVGAVLFGMFIDKSKQSESKLFKGSVGVLTKCTAAFCFLSIFIYTAMMYCSV